MEIDAEGYVTNVVDGDTLDVSNFGRIRLADIDAPESYENGYDEAKNYLRDLVDNKLVYIDKDPEQVSYGRFVCVIYMQWNSTHLLNVNKAILTEGVAEIWDYPNEFNPSTWTLYVHYPETDSDGGNGDNGSGDDGGNGGEVPSDTTAPIIGNVEVNPSSGSAGTVFIISANVNDPSGVKTVIGYIQNPDGMNIATLTLTEDDNNGIYTGLWYGTGASIGTYWIDIVATDNYDNSIEGNNLVSCAVSKSTTMILCSVSSSSLTIGIPITISGSITPALGGKIVTLTYMKPDGFTFTRTVTTNNGEYSDTYTPDMLGSWRVSASWVGDATHEGASSSSKAFTVSKLSSTISCSVSSSSLMIGNSVTVSGSLIPTLSGKDVILTYTKPDRSTFTKTVTTSSDGSYSDTYTPDTDGLWGVKASWTGDTTYSYASSSSMSFTVSKLSSSLSCSIPSSDLTVGDSVTISGSILTVSGVIPPPQTGVPIILSYKSDGVWSTLTTVTSTDNGSYSHTWTTQSVASYKLKASWKGDNFFTGATSNELSVTVSKISTSISCSVSSTTVTRGESINVSGTIDPLLSDIIIIFTYTKPDGSLFTRSVTTASDGSFSDSYFPDSDGSWSVTVSWDGNSMYNDTVSSKVEFTVNTSIIGGPGWADDMIVIGGFSIFIVISLFMTFKRSLVL